MVNEQQTSEGARWFVGIDEAGYGPNLGPMVQVCVAVQVPSDCTCVWEHLHKTVRRAEDVADHRILIDDSKTVYTGKQGLARLELGAALASGKTFAGVWEDWLQTICAVEHQADLQAESWFNPKEPLPVAGTVKDIEAMCRRFEDVCLTESVTVCLPGSVVTATPRFNAIIDEHQSKAATTSRGVVELLQRVMSLPDPSVPITICVDKQGGRNFYGPLLDEAFPEGWVMVVWESAERSEYRIESLDREVKVIFRPKAEKESFSVALASMIAKYIREVSMLQFNRFWQSHLPGLKPTAGYPVDAARFLNEIRPLMTQLGLTDDQVWRKR